jgi:GntR family transcriptional regulator / MocR family aminotransferase
MTLSRQLLTSSSNLPLARQVANLLRNAILSRQIRAGARLPSTRGLAGELGVSRTTVLDAYAQLSSEGILDARTGAGTFVAAIDRVAGSSPGARTRRSAQLSARGTAIVGMPRAACGNELRAFNPGFPCLDGDAFRTWWRLFGRRSGSTSGESLSYGAPGGLRRLREAIAAWIGPSRGVHCVPEQVIITAGCQQAIHLAAQLLIDPGDEVWIEDPGYSGTRAALGAAGGCLIPVCVDGDGLSVDAGSSIAPGARLACVTPSHQYPSGVTMPIERRLALIAWAARAGAWILEDDYDSEFRHTGRLLPALAAVDSGARTLYVGTFSKSLFPALGLGYLIVPADLVDAFHAAQSARGDRVPVLDQSVLADFIEQGHFARHVKRMRARYRTLRGTLEDEMKRRVGDALTVTGAAVGLHVCAQLVSGLRAADVSRQALAHGVTAPAVSAYQMRGPSPSALVLGYGHLDDGEIRAGLELLARAIDSTARVRATAPP